MNKETMTLYIYIYSLKTGLSIFTHKVIESENFYENEHLKVNKNNLNKILFTSKNSLKMYSLSNKDNDIFFDKVVKYIKRDFDKKK